WQSDEARSHRLESVADFYAARQSLVAAGAGVAPLYRPVKPEQMFIPDPEWDTELTGRAVVQLSPFAAPEADASGFDAGARPAKNFAAERADSKIQLFEAVRDYLDAERKSGKRVAIAAYSAGAADRLATVLRERGLSDLRAVADGGALAALPKSAIGLAILPPEHAFTNTLPLHHALQAFLPPRLPPCPA